MKPLLLRIKHSLPLRLLLLFMVVCVCIITLLVAALARGFGNQWEGGIKPHLNQYLSYVNQDIGNPPDVQRAEELARHLPINIYIEGPEQQYSSTGQPLDTHELEFHDSHDRWERRKDTKNYLEQNNQALSFGELDDRTVLRNHLGDYTVYYEVRHRDATARRSGTAWRAVAWLLGILAISYWLLRRMLKPVQEIKHGVQMMGAGALDHRVPVRSDNDLGELANSINDMAGDIEDMLDAKRQLLLALSHELRSPLTRAKIAVQMLESSTTQQAIEEDLNEMQALISEILDAERMNGRHSKLKLAEVNPRELLEEVILEFESAGVKLDTSASLPRLLLDETRIKLMLRNLINNALTHSQDTNRPPLVSAQRLDGILRIDVQDYGHGIAEQHLSKVTEPFYRADASRSRSTGGFGLGLHLCKLIAESHGGNLHIYSKLGEGSRMSVELPIDRQAENAGVS